MRQFPAGAAPRHRLLVLLLTALVVASGLAFRAFPAAAVASSAPMTQPIDFLAFYCGAKTLANGGDPYRAEPLRTCERAALAESAIALSPHLVVPAPLPPYALAAISPLTRLSFRAASLLQFILNMLVIGLTVAVLARLTRLSPIVVALPAIVSESIASLLIGQIVPVVVLAICACALALRFGRVWVAAAFATVAMLEPHLGLPVLVALFVLKPRARFPVAVSLLACSALSVASSSAALNVEYLVRVLPAHALSEVHNFYAQYSATAAASRIGFRDAVALHIGEFWYIAMIGVGVLVAARNARSKGDAAYVVLAPPALAVIGGVFVHIQQMAVALPLALLLFADSPAAMRRILLPAIVLLAVPWQSLYELHLLGPFLPAVHVDLHRSLARVSDGATFADTVWQARISHVGELDGRTTWQIVLYKLPTWLALVTLGFVGYGARPRPSPVAPVVA